MASEKATSDGERWIEAVTRMIELTQSGELEWQIGESYGPERGDPTTPPYVAEYKDRRYRIQGRWVRTSTHQTVVLNDIAKWFKAESSPPRDGEAVRLEMIDNRGRTLYRVPSVGPVRDLLYAVQRQTADPDAALQDLLG